VQEEYPPLVQEQEEGFPSFTRSRICYFHRTATFHLYKKKTSALVPDTVPEMVSYVVPDSAIVLLIFGIIFGTVSGTMLMIVLSNLEGLQAS